MEPLMTQYDYLQAAQVLHDAAAAGCAAFHQDRVSPAWSHQRVSSGCCPNSPAAALSPRISTRSSKTCFVTEGSRWMATCMARRQQLFVQRLLRGERCILKLHGDARQANTYVELPRRNIRAAYGGTADGPFAFQNQLPRALRQIFISHPCCSWAAAWSRTKRLICSSPSWMRGRLKPDYFALLDEPATPQDRARKEDRLQLKIRPCGTQTPADAEGNPDHS